MSNVCIIAWVYGRVQESGFAIARSMRRSGWG